MRRFVTGILFLTLIIVFFGWVLTASALEKPVRGIKVILVNVDEQKLYAVDNYQIIYEFDVITGRPGKETTTGRFKTFKKIKDYTSKKYGSPMPYTMFFSKDGKAIHGTKWATLRSYLHTYLTESVGSMGCVGLTEEDAKILFEWAPVGTVIAILDVAEEKE